MSKLYITERQIRLLQEMYNDSFSPENVNDIIYYVNEPEDEDDERSFDIECCNKMGETIYDESNVYESELFDIFGERITNIILKREGTFNGRYYSLSDIMDTSISNLDDVNEVIAVAKKCFPTYDFYSKDMRGYILTDGSILYFGDSIDHASISWVDGMTVGKFVSLGNIRIGHQTFELAKEPTYPQMRTLTKLISSYRNDYLYVDIIGYNGGTYGNILTSAQYAYPNAEWVLGQIEDFFQNGNKLISEEKLNESMTYSEIDAEVKKVNTNPTDKQKESGNYKMGHINVLGFNITIENPMGSYRQGKDKNGKKWKVKMQNHYGYFTKTKGKDGDHIDVFVGKHLDSQKVFVVDQVNLKGEFDESKVMLGFRNAKEAKNAYMSNYSKDWKGFKQITGVELDVFKEWLYDGYRQRKPFADYVQIKKRKLDESRLTDWLFHSKQQKIPSIKGKTYYDQDMYFIVFKNNTTKDFSILDTMRDAWVSINGKTRFKRVCTYESPEFAIDFGNGKWHEIDLESVRERQPNLEKLEYKWI